MQMTARLQTLNCVLRLAHVYHGLSAAHEGAGAIFFQTPKLIPISIT